jgi:hypothetical protein
MQLQRAVVRMRRSAFFLAVEGSGPTLWNPAPNAQTSTSPVQAGSHEIVNG